MNIQAVHDCGLIMDGHIDPDEAEDAAYAWLTANGAGAWDLRDTRNHIARLPTVRAWWIDGTGFANEEHPESRPVVVVHVPNHLSGL